MFKGAGTAIATPFDEDFNVDYASFKKLIQFQLKNNIDAIVVLGTTGESPVINDEERRKIIATAVEEINGKVPVIVGTGSNDTHHVTVLNKIAEEYKADGLLIVNPYYNKGTQDSLVQHYKYIAERTSLPIMLYNVPSRTSMNLLPETVVKIHTECPNVTSIKEASGSISQIAQLFSIKPDTLSVLSGNDDQTLPILALGGQGVISVFTNAFPSEMKNLTNAFFANDLSSAQYYNNLYLKMMNLLFIETSPSPLKYVLSRLNLCKNVLRLPLAPVSSKSEKLLDEEMERLKTNSYSLS